MKVLRILGYISLCLVVLVGIGLYACTRNVGKALDQAAAPPAGQTYSIKDNHVVIHTPLEPKMGVVLQGFQGCNMDEIKALNGSLTYSAGSGCVGDVCTMTLDFGRRKIPDTLDVFVKAGPAAPCAKKTLTGKDLQPVATGYTAKIGISGELKDYFAKLPDQSGFKINPVSKFQGSGSFGFNGQVSISLTYTAKVSDDTFFYDGQAVQVVYDGGQ